MKKNKKLSILAPLFTVLLLLILGAGYYLWRHHSLSCQSPIQISSWKEALGRTTSDKSNLQLTKVLSSPSSSLYVGALHPGEKSTSVWHSGGEEVFQVLAGTAILHSGQMGKEKRLSWYENLKVKEGDAFLLPPGTVLQIEAGGQEAFIFSLFAPDGHFKDDRYFVDDYQPGAPSSCQ